VRRRPLPWSLPYPAQLTLILNRGLA